VGDPCDPDIDGDGALNAADCAPLDSGSHAVPGEAGGLEIAGDTLSWTGLDGQAGPAVLYDLIRGGVADLFVDDGVDGAVCLAGSDPGPSIVDGDDPVPGEARYYLIRGRNICGLGPFGWSSSGAPRVNTACP
jgi:hypothetical protein